MTLAAMLAAHDDVALEALASKGLVRRARREVEAGLWSVQSRENGSAVVMADGQQVIVDAKGPQACRCPCPADGLCRHILVAIVALRDAPAPEAAADPPQAESARPASVEICELSQSQLEKFSGADWSAAKALAASAQNVEFAETGANCTVEFDDGAASVTFIAGQALKDAAYKGAKSRRRLIIACCAILIRARAGIALGGDSDEPESIAAALPSIFLDEAAGSLIRAVRMTLSGSPVLAADTLFDLAISARVETAPRLAAALRSLSRQARLAASRDINFHPETFIAEAARAAALIEALRTAGSAPHLTGSLRRDYRPAPAMTPVFVGASSWRSETGARGLTLHAVDPGSRRWFAATLARGAGQDPNFSPSAAYRMPIWSADTPERLMGRAVRFDEPLLSDDGAIAPTLPRRPEPVPSLDMETLREVVRDNWQEMRADLGERFGSGLGRRAMPVPALIAPARIVRHTFNEMAQAHEVIALDREGEALTLSLDADADILAKRLREEGGRHDMILIEAGADLDRAVCRPISLISRRDNKLEVINLDLDHWPKQRFALPAIEPLAALRRDTAPAIGHDLIRDTAQRALTAAVAAAGGAPYADLGAVERSAESLGLATLAASLQRLAQRPEASGALATAYLAAELLTASAFV